MKANQTMTGPPVALRPPAMASANGTSKPPPEAKVNILLVDDRPDKLLALGAILESLGQNIVRASSGKEALRQLLKQDFAVILLDVSMPGMDGFETAALIRKRVQSEHTPIIFVTSIGDSESHISQGYSLGAVDYILTPIVPAVLRTKVSVFVELSKKTELIKRQAEQLRRIEESRHQQELALVADRLELETKRNRFFTLALDLLGIADFEGRLLQANPAWEKVLGYSPDELKTFSGLDLVHPDERSAMMERIAALKNGQCVTYCEGRYRHQDGSYRWIGWTAAPFISENLIYVFARDITPRRMAEEQVSLLNRELEDRVAALTDINRELESFNYSISHDLRAPLRSMSSFSQALIEDEGARMSPQGLDFARRINRSAKYMDTLLHDLLTYSRLARTEISLAPVNLEEPVTEALALFENEIRQRVAQVEVVAPLGTVLAHLPTLKQILSNLIGNCLKFVFPERRLHLRILTVSTADWVRLWVEDNGIGIAPEHHEKIFGLFQRLHDSQAYPGTGIGLALVRKGAERMGGRVGVESQAGHGSRFWVELPAVKSVS